MRIEYSCDICGQPIDAVEVDALDEAKFGFDCLTADERQEIIRYDAASGVMYVQSLCDGCIAAMGLEGGTPVPPRRGLLH